MLVQGDQALTKPRLEYVRHNEDWSWDFDPGKAIHGREVSDEAEYLLMAVVAGHEWKNGSDLKVRVEDNPDPARLDSAPKSVGSVWERAVETTKCSIEVPELPDSGQ